jgi:hypothetical protein
MYQTEVNDLPNLRHRIIDAVASITLKMLRNTCSDTKYLLDLGYTTRQSHVEIY